MDTQRPIFERMAMGPLAENLSGILYPNRKPDDLVYAEYAYRVQEPNTFSRNRRESYFEHDVILFLQHYGQRGGREKTLQKDVISIEIKTTERNTMESEVGRYLGATRMFYIAAPGPVLPAVIRRYYEDRDRRYIGIIDSDEGEVVARAMFQDYDDNRQSRLLAQCYTSNHRIPQYNNVEPFLKQRLSKVMPPAVTWRDMDGFKVNERYLDLFYEHRRSACYPRKYGSCR